MADGGSLFMAAVKTRVDESLDACTRCGKCVEACPMVEPAGLDPANSIPIVEGVLDLLAGGAGTPDAERWAQVCTNSGKCIPACDYGVNPRFMVNMARIASMTRRKGEAEVRRGAQQYFNNMGRSTRIISRLQLAPELLERLAPPLRAPDEYERTPDIVFYTGCNVIKTPHIMLLVLEVLDALGVSYEVMGGTATCCGIQQFKRGDAKVAGRLGFNTIERLARPGASRVVSWCPSCFIQIGEVAMPAYTASTGRAMPFEIAPLVELFAERLDDLRPLFVNRVEKRVALQERSAVPGIITAVKAVLRAIPGLEVVELDVPVMSTQASHLSVLPQFKEELRQREIRRRRGRRDDHRLDLPRLPPRPDRLSAASEFRAVELHGADRRGDGHPHPRPLQAPAPDGRYRPDHRRHQRHDRRPPARPRHRPRRGGGGYVQKRVELFVDRGVSKIGLD